MSKKSSNKKNITFKNYLVILLVVLSIIITGLIYFINVLPMEYFLVYIFVLIIVDLIVSWLLLAKGKVKNLIGGLFALILSVVMIFGINYSLNTMDFFKQFGFNEYKTENYNVLVLKESKINKINDLDEKVIGHMDENLYEGLKKTLDKISKNISFDNEKFDDVSELLNSLEKRDVDAIILEDAQLDIINEENNVDEILKKIDVIKVEVKISEVGKSVDVTSDPFNVYISGIDTYGSINKVSRSDVNMIMSVNPKTKEILLTNIPRDYYVKLHTFKEYDKLTHAGIYGVDESIKTLEDLFDTKINYYIKVNFTSLEDLVDALDGITVFSQFNFTSQDGYTYKYGENVLDGKKALSFARERKSFKDGDRERGKNQQLILTSIINKAISPKILTNYVDILKALKGKFVTNISDNDISKLIKIQLNSGSSWNIKTISVDGNDAMDYVYSYKKTKLYVMKPDKKTVNNAKESIKNVLKNND